MKKLANTLINVMIVICVGLIGFSAYKVVDFEINARKQAKEEREVEDAIDQVIEETEQGADEEHKPLFTKEAYKKLKEINYETIGYFAFESGIIKQPVVQGVNNSYYLNHSYKDRYNTQGAVFMDCANKPSDTNITLYGHYVYADEKKMFSPLKKLKTQSGYEKNSIAYYFDANGRYTYHVLYVFEINVYEDDYDYTTSNFANEKRFTQFISTARKYSLIDSEETIDYGDRMMTLQTCVKNQSDKRLVVMLKQMDFTPYEEIEW